MPRVLFRPPVREGEYLEELHQPEGRVFPLGRRRSLAEFPKPDLVLENLSEVEKRVLVSLAGRRGSIGVKTLTGDCELVEGQIRAVLAGLCRHGLVRVEEKNTRPTLGIDFQIERAEPDIRSLDAVRRWLGRRNPEEDQHEAVSLLKELEGRLSDGHPLVAVWRDCILSFRNEIESGGRPKLYDEKGTIAQYPGGKFRVLVQACAFLAIAVSLGETSTLRELSDRACGHSKALDGYRPELARAMGCPLDELGVVSDLPILCLKISASGRLVGRTVWLDGGVPYVCLTGPSAAQWEPESVEARSILAVENKAAFRHLVEIAGLPEGIGCIWLHGQRGLERRLLAKIAPRLIGPIYVWTDIDAWGMYIQDSVAAAVAPYATTIPVLMRPADLIRATTPQELSTVHRSLLEHFEPTSRWFSVAQTMLGANAWVEQEEFLAGIRDAMDVQTLLSGIETVERIP